MNMMKNLAIVSLFLIALSCSSREAVREDVRPAEATIATTDVASAERLIGLEFTPVERDSMIDALVEQRSEYEHLRTIPLANDVPSALQFNPMPHNVPLPGPQQPFVMSDPGKVVVPADPNGLAFYSIGQLGYLLKNRLITSVQLTRVYLDRLKKYDPKLHCVVTLTEDIALAQAERADQEISRGMYKGPLHGIPFGLKDMFTTKAIPTTWGATPYKDQTINVDATIYERLRYAGAVLVAKLSMGELAWGDVWFGGMTRNPWDLEQGSSGSSAGPAAAVSAGLVAFAIGSETWGSIVSPSARCGVTGLRPTYGRVSRTGAMALAPSMDKIGPICRTVEDCAIVLNAIRGPDHLDRTLVDIPFNYDPNLPMDRFQIGYVMDIRDSLKAHGELYDSTLAMIYRLGAGLIPLRLPSRGLKDLPFILSAEAAATFDDLTRSGNDDMLVRQIKDAWPNVLRAARLIPAVEYLQANRVRYLLVKDMEIVMNKVDAIAVPSLEGDHLLLTNLTGHPCITLPNGFTKDGHPTSITFIGRLFDEGNLMVIAKKFQDATDFNRRHPNLD